MTVKELITGLEQCNQEFEVYCGYAQDDLLDANIILEVLETKTVATEKDRKYCADGVYIRIG